MVPESVPEEQFELQITGSGFTAAGLKPGDLLLIDPNKNPTEESLAAVWENNLLNIVKYNPVSALKVIGTVIVIYRKFN